MRLSTRRGDLDRAPRSDAAAERWSLVIAVALTFFIVWALPSEPDRVTVIVDNPTDHRLYIMASTPGDEGLGFVTIVGPRSTKTTPDVVDRGPRWTLHLRTPSGPAGTIEVARVDLVTGSVVIPNAIAPETSRPGAGTEP